MFLNPLHLLGTEYVVLLSLVAREARQAVHDEAGNIVETMKPGSRAARQPGSRAAGQSSKIQKALVFISRARLWSSKSKKTCVFVCCSHLWSPKLKKNNGFICALRL